jgi:hypothetical protein
MRTLLLSVCSVAVLAAAAVAQPSPNPLFQPPQDDAFGSSFFAAPNSRTLPNGSEVPLPTPVVPATGRPLVANRFWIAPEYFHAASSRTILPPLVTTSPAGTATAGVLGRNSTTVAFGGNQLSGLRPAMRLGLGASLTDTLAVDGSFLALFEESAEFARTSSPGGLLLARPLVLNGVESAAVLGQLGAQAGIDAVADTFAIGGDVNLRYTVGGGELARWDLFAGYRYFQVRDRVRVTTREQTPLPQTLPGGEVTLPVVLTGTSTVTDKFHTRNEFHGPQFGVASTFRLLDRLTFATRFGVAMGVTLSDTRISGRTSGPVSFDGGLLATASNSGQFRSHYFSVIPSAEARVGLDVTDWLRLTAGYSFLYWSRLERAADQIDRTIATGRPAYPHRTTDYWLQGVTLGAEVRY